MNKALIKLFNNPIGRFYLGVPKGKRIYKITQSSCHYYTGEIAKNGMPIICTGNCSPNGNFVFNRIMKLAKVVSAFAFVPFFPASLLPLIALTNTGWKNPSATGGHFNSFANPTNAYTSDNQYAFREMFAASYYYQSYENFNFGIPSDVVIQGIEMSVKGYTTSSGIFISHYIHSTSAGQNRIKNCQYNSYNSIYTLGNFTDLWGCSWIASDFSNANFYIYVQTAKIEFKFIYLDHIQVKVYYTINGPFPTHFRP